MKTFPGPGKGLRAYSSEQAASPPAPYAVRFHTKEVPTVDRILALSLLIERRREFDRELLAAYIDFKKAFDSVSRVPVGDTRASRDPTDSREAHCFPVF